jgi:hypothetical protein
MSAKILSIYSGMSIAQQGEVFKRIKDKAKQKRQAKGAKNETINSRD